MSPVSEIAEVPVNDYDTRLRFSSREYVASFNFQIPRAGYNSQAKEDGFYANRGPDQTRSSTVNHENCGISLIPQPLAEQSQTLPDDVFPRAVMKLGWDFK